MIKGTSIVRHAVLLAASAAMLSASPVLADELVTKSVNVSFAGVNLGTPAGQKTMHSRMRQAARAVCDYNGSTRELREIGAQTRCMTNAMKAAEIKLAAATTMSGNQLRMALGDGAPRR